jgi:hypothetical protein
MDWLMKFPVWTHRVDSNHIRSTKVQLTSFWTDCFFILNLRSIFRFAIRENRRSKAKQFLFYGRQLSTHCLNWVSNVARVSLFQLLTEFCYQILTCVLRVTNYNVTWNFGSKNYEDAASSLASFFCSWNQVWVMKSRISKLTTVNNKL